MAIKLDCPRCKRPLSVPSKKAGQYAKCPSCGGRFWVPENATEGSGELDEVLTESVVPASASRQSASRSAGHAPAATTSSWPATSIPIAPSPATPTPANTTPAAATPPTPADSVPAEQPVDRATPGPTGAATAAATPSDATPTDAVPVAATEAGHKTARFVSADAAGSVLKPAEDGKLPELHLREGPRSQRKPKQKDTTVNPLVLFGLLSLSVVLSIAMVLFEPAPPQAGAKQEARRQIEQWFFPREGEKPLPYQEYLMAAQRAGARGDHATERRLYSQVLDLLRQQRPGYVEDSKQWSLTTSVEYDKKLEDQLCILLNDD